jgi:5-methylcytosine-specific restriction endonuclease McrBC GTP-binding regulatory subunit McrB
MITLNKLTNHVSGYEVHRDGTLIGLVRPHSIRYWRIFDSARKPLGERFRTRKSAIAELDRMITARPDPEPQS